MTIPLTLRRYRFESRGSVSAITSCGDAGPEQSNDGLKKRGEADDVARNEHGATSNVVRLMPVSRT
jgi:hypothetical protein